MITSKQLVEGSNFIDGTKGEYIGTFWNGDHFIACFDSKRMNRIDRFSIVDEMVLFVIPFDSQEDYPNEYSVEAFGVVEGKLQAVLLDLEN